MLARSLADSLVDEKCFDRAAALYQQLVRSNEFSLTENSVSTESTNEMTSDAVETVEEKNPAQHLELDELCATLSQLCETRVLQLGPSHPDALRSKIELAGVLCLLERYEEAFDLYIDVHKTQLVLPGQMSSDTDISSDTNDSAASE